MVLALLLGGVGMPVPEELALVTAGYWIWRGYDGAHMAMAAMVAVWAGDLTLYLIGRGGARLRPVARLVGAERRHTLEAAFARHGAKLVLAGRFVPGLRSAMLLAAGASRMPLLRLAVWDGVGGCLAVALWLSVGLRLGPHLERARTLVEDGRAVALVAAVAAGAWLLLRRRAQRQA